MKRVSSEREPTSDERDYERIVVAELRRRLPEGEGIKSCEGFRHAFSAATPATTSICMTK
jgi:hypothetical protein